MRYICRSSRGLSLSTSHWSVSVSPGKPQTWASARPLTGLEPPGLGNHRRMLQVGQLGPPHMETSPCAAMVHSVLYGSAANMSSPYFRNLSMCQLPGQMGISMRGVHGDMRPGIQHRPCRHKGAEPLVSNLTWSRCGM